MTFNHGMRIDVDIEIDDFTPCLIHRLSGERYETEVERLAHDDLASISNEAGWIGFQWSTYMSSASFEVYKLRVQGDTTIQGVICLEPKESWFEVHLVENAPWNIGQSSQEFRGVGAHLFAIACKRSFECGAEGFVAFQAKTNLVEYYMRSLRAERVGANRLYIGTEQARLLVDTYFNGER